MDILEIVFLLIIGSTLLMFLLHKLCEKSNNGFARLINNLWMDWFENQWNGILAFILITIGIFLVISLVR